jgi:isopenicillin N synthase-like dioxygenase
MASEWSIPVINVGPYIAAGDVASRASVARSVDEANRTVGFLQVVGHGIPDGTIAGLTEAIDSIFSLPLEEKMALCALPKANRGYCASQSSSLSRTIGIEQTYGGNDYFEAYNVGTTAEDFPGLDLPTPPYASNLWPSIDGWRDRVNAYRLEAARVARTLVAIYADALDLPPGFFDPFIDHPVEMLRMVNYDLAPGSPPPVRGQRGMGEHTDFGIVTVLWADRVPGLQVLGADGVWHDVLPEPGALLVNLGDMMARWTNDRWLSTLHRVIPPVIDGTIARRRSAAFFQDGNHDALIETLPVCLSADGTSHYEPIDVATHLARKVAGGRGPLTSGAEREAERVRAAG